jgi:catalase
VGDGFDITPEEVVDGVNERYGRHPGYRALHAKGFFYRATFIATPEAARLTRAAHMQGSTVAAMVRLSNGSGRPDSKDYVPDVRGLAVSFELPDGSRTDLLAQTAPNFPINSPKGFVQVVQANVAGLARLVKFPVFLARNPSALPGLPGNLRALAPPRSYATRRYYPIHTFKWLDADGGEHFVKYTWLPEAGEESISAKEAKQAGPDYLRDEMQERLARGPVRFALQLKIAQEGDVIEDPRANWPDDRETLTAGTLEITELDPDAEKDGQIVVFDPMRLTDGIEPSGDRVLEYRPRAYSVSAERRSG